MAEHKLVYTPKKVKYSGLFSVAEVHKFLMNWFSNQNYDMVEELTEEQVLENGKQITYDYRPYKKFSDFAKSVIYIKVEFDNVQEVKVEIDKVTKKMNKGDITFTITGYVETDYENKWETKPFYYFLKVVFEKFVLGSHRHYYESYVNKHCKLIIEEFKAHLNLNRLKV